MQDQLNLKHFHRQTGKEQCPELNFVLGMVRFLEGGEDLSKMQL
jgi:hypothetical protein